MSSFKPEDRREKMEEFVDCLSRPEDTLMPLLFPGQGLPESVSQEQLRLVCQLLFTEIERLATSHASLARKGKFSTTLSGLEELYLGPNDAGRVDAETLWGQVELQNEALHSILRSSVKTLAKVIESGNPDDIRLLDMSEVVSDSEEDKEGSDGSSVEDDADEETLRIHARMNRAMADIEGGSEADSDSVGGMDELEPRPVEADHETQSLEDPAANELNDGFFSIQDMEAFADEEEEFLPDEAFGKPRPRDEYDEPKKSFHQRQRDDDLDSRDDSEEDAPPVRQEGNEVRRKRYREDDEIDALYSLYEEDQNDSDDNVVDMTAANLFGKPNSKYFNKWRANHRTVHWNNNNHDNDEATPSADNDLTSEGNNDNSVDEDGVRNGEDGSKEVAARKSSHSGHSDKLLFQTEQVEIELLAEKPWQMSGEAKGSARPVNSLLEVAPEFEVATKAAPLITVEHSASLEDVIKSRIISEDWDDVVPRELPDVAWNKKRGELPEVSQEKSKLGLGELYEREYLKKAAGYNVDTVEKQSEEERVKNEMKGLFANLCSKLDALSNYNFAPRPIADEAEVRPVSTPAIAMEEVMPLHVSDARGVAPEEVYAPRSGREGVIRGDTEMDQAGRKRLRGAKKTARRKARKQKLADEKLLSKLQPGLGLNNPYEKRKMREDLSMARSSGKLKSGQQDADANYGASTTFFKRLQAQAEQSVQGSSGIRNKSGRTNAEI